MEKPKRRSKVEVLLPDGTWEVRITRLVKKAGLTVLGSMGVYWFKDYEKTWHESPRKVKAVRPSDLILPGVNNG
jgi:hypothetical protein